MSWSRRVTLACGCLALLGCAMQLAHAENYALLIGINKYPNATADLKELDYAEKDATDLYAMLLGRGFKPDNMKLLAGDDRARKTDILRELRNFARNPDIGADDQFLVFFSGHGLLDGVTGKSFWLAHDTTIATIEDSGIRLEHLMDFVTDVKAGRKLVLLDHCFSGQIVNRARSPTSGGLSATAAPAVSGRDADLTSTVAKSPIPLVTIKQALQQRASGLAVIAAAFDKSYETKALTNGIFTKALIQALDSKVADTSADGSLSLDELRIYVADKVTSMAHDANREQQVAEQMTAVDGTHWIVVASLPVGNLQTAKDEQKAAMRLLIKWEFDQWIKPETKRDCRDAYAAQVQSLETNSKMADNVANVLRNCRNYLKDSAITDKQKADDLQEVLSAIHPEVTP